MQSSRILRIREVCALTGLSASTIYRLKRRDRFPDGIQLSPNAVGWLLEEVNAWITSRTATSRPEVRA